MRELISKFTTFITHMDEKATRAVLVSIGLFALVAAMFLGGQVLFDLGSLDPNQVRDWFSDTSSRWYALPLTILAFTALSFVGAPNFALMTGAIVAFGPVYGFFYAWIATMSASTVHFVLGRFLGPDLLKRFGDGEDGLAALVERKGWLAVFASAIVRWVPSGPAIMVNMAFGVARAPYWAFLLGLSIGAAAKIFTVSLIGESVITMWVEQNLFFGVAFLVFLAVWIGAMLVARRWLRRKKVTLTDENPSPDADISSSTEP